MPHSAWSPGQVRLRGLREQVTCDIRQDLGRIWYTLVQGGISLVSNFGFFILLSNGAVATWTSGFYIRNTRVTRQEC